MCHWKCFSTRDMGCSSARSRNQDTSEAQSQSFPSALKNRARLTLHPAGALTRLFANVLRLDDPYLTKLGEPAPVKSPADVEQQG
jgi:hypothetical protein